MKWNEVYSINKNLFCRVDPCRSYQSTPTPVVDLIDISAARQKCGEQSQILGQGSLNNLCFIAFWTYVWGSHLFVDYSCWRLESWISIIRQICIRGRVVMMVLGWEHLVEWFDSFGQQQQEKWWWWPSKASFDHISVHWFHYYSILNVFWQCICAFYVSEATLQWQENVQNNIFWRQKFWRNYRYFWTRESEWMIIEWVRQSR